MATFIHGPRTWSATRNSEGHREYKLKTLIRCTSTLDGPATILQTPGLPVPGGVWHFGNDLDLWAFCGFDATVSIHQEKEGDPNRWATVEQTFTTDPPSLCVDAEISDPLLEPAKVSGGFTKYTEEATRDRYQRPITNSAHEQITGATNEWDANRGTLRIEQNVATLYQAAVLPSIFMDRVNGAPIWGLPYRTVKLSSGSWERKFHGQCHLYYSRTLEFDIKYDTFDRLLSDKGTLALHGHWDDKGFLGSGCTVNPGIIAGGVVTSATLIGGGTGYAKSAAFDLTVLDGTGVGCIITVQTDKDGVVIAIVGVVNGGFDYTGLPASSVVKTRWVLDLINGRPPNRFNPGHFDRYKDRKEQAATIALDGRGKPYEGFVQNITTCDQCPGSPAPISSDPAQGGTSRVWRVQGNTGVFAPLNTLLIYQSGCIWVGKSKNILAGGLPSGTSTLEYVDGAWKLHQVILGGDATWFYDSTNPADPASFIEWNCNGPNTMHKIGAFKETITLTPATEEADAPGAIFVSVYGDADFLLLGVPITF